MKTKTLLIALATTTGLAVASANAAVYTLGNIVRPAGGSALTESFDFVTNDGWSGTPPNTISGEDSLYMKVTVSWAAATDIGTFQARFNFNDDGGAARWGVGKNSAGTSGFEFIMSNTNADPDGAGPATVRPTIVAINTNSITSVTLVLKVDQVEALANAAGDRWYGDITQQSLAYGFMWINPNLGATEASQPTVWAAARSGNYSYQGMSFITDTAGSVVTFSNITIYTGVDTPFAVPEPSSLALVGVGGLLVGRRRRS